jgi:hypothetical protein
MDEVHPTYDSFEVSADKDVVDCGEFNFFGAVCVRFAIEYTYQR